MTADKFDAASEVNPDQKVQNGLKNYEKRRIRDLEAIKDCHQDKGQAQCEQPDVEPRALVGVVYLL